MKIIDQRQKLLVLAFGLVLTFGLIINLRGQVGPLIQKDYGLTYSQFGFALSFLSIGGILFNLLGGVLIERIGLKIVLLIGLIISGLGLLTVNYSATYLMLVIAMIVLGTGITLLNLTATSLVSTLSRQDKGKAMNFFHFFFGIGGILAPIYANAVLNLGFSWEVTYLFSGLLILLFIVISFNSDFPSHRETKNKDLGQLLLIIKDTRVVLFILMFLFYCGAELGLASWLSLYLTDVQNRSQAEIQFYVSGFFFCFTFGRLIAGQLVEKVGYFLWVLVAIISAIVFVLAGMLGPNSWAVMFSLAGLFLAGIFPTIQAIMFDTFTSDSMPTILGATLTAASIGFMILGDWGIGYVNDLVGIEFGFGIVIFYLLIFLAFLLYFKKKYLCN